MPYSTICRRIPRYREWACRLVALPDPDRWACHAAWTLFSSRRYGFGCFSVPNPSARTTLRVTIPEPGELGAALSRISGRCTRAWPDLPRRHDIPGGTPNTTEVVGSECTCRITLSSGQSQYRHHPLSQAHREKESPCSPSPMGPVRDPSSVPLFAEARPGADSPLWLQLQPSDPADVRYLWSFAAQRVPAHGAGHANFSGAWTKSQQS